MGAEPDREHEHSKPAVWKKRREARHDIGIAQRFFSLNRQISSRITPSHIHEANVIGVYRKVGAMLLSHPGVTRVLDVGAGKHWHFPEHYKAWYNIYLIGADISENEMESNRLLDEKIVADVTNKIPVEPEFVDLLMVNSGIEHFKDNERFMKNAFTVLRPGGFVLAQFPNRYAPFAIINRILPPRLARRILTATMTDTSGVLGFRAHYDRTSYGAFQKIYQRIGFRELYYLPGFYSSTYFEFFIPIFLVSYIYDAVRFAIGVKTLASYHLWILQKPESDGPSDLAFRFYAWK